MMRETHNRWDTALLVMAVCGGLTMMLPFVSIPLTAVALGASLWRWFGGISRSNRALYALLTSASVAVILSAVMIVAIIGGA